MKAILAIVLTWAGAVVLAFADDSAARNLALARGFTEALGRGEIDAAIAYFAPDASNFGRPVSREGFRKILDDIHTTFPDWKMEVVDSVASADSVVLRCKVSATHRGVGKLPINGGLLVGVPPSGRHFEVQHIHSFKLRDGKIVDHYATRDDLGMMQQLGLLPQVSRPDTQQQPAPPGR